MADHAQMLMEALDFIEENLSAENDVETIANHLYVSVSTLQKTFYFAFHMYVKEYVIRRRFSVAAKEILNTDESITDIAMKYGYSSSESFTRGFRKIWGISPSEYRKTRTFAGITPKFASPMDQTMEVGIMEGMKYDLTELVELLKTRKQNAYVLADINHLMEINDKYGTEAGDAALLELVKRVETACNETDVLLRIGGDEFVVFTDSQDLAHAEEIASKVNAHDGETITVNGNEFPIYVSSVAFVGFVDSTNPNEIMSDVKERIRKSREN